MHETPQNNSKYTLILFTCELWVLQVVVRMLVIHSYMAISIIFLDDDRRLFSFVKVPDWQVEKLFSDIEGPLQQVQLLYLLLERRLMWTPCPFTFDQVSWKAAFKFHQKFMKVLICAWLYLSCSIPFNHLSLICLGCCTEPPRPDTNRGGLVWWDCQCH